MAQQLKVADVIGQVYIGTYSIVWLRHVGNHKMDGVKIIKTVTCWGIDLVFVDDEIRAPVQVMTSPATVFVNKHVLFTKMAIKGDCPYLHKLF